MTIGGSPSIYAGDEQAFRGVKEHRVGGDDEVRPAFPERPADLAPEGWPVHALHGELIALRRDRPWLIDGRTEVRHLTNETIVYRTTARGDGGAFLDVALNVADGPLRLPGAKIEPLAGQVASGGRVIPPHGWAIGRLRGR